MEHAMAQVIENRADIEGRVVSVAPIAERPEYRLVTIDVSGVLPVEGYANMFARAPGTRLEVIVSASHAEVLRIGATVGCRIRRGGPKIVIGDYCVEH